jgi:hypothetical protein
MKNMAFWTSISPRFKKRRSENAMGTRQIAVSVTGALAPKDKD